CSVSFSLVLFCSPLRCPNEFTGDRCQTYVMASFYSTSYFPLPAACAWIVACSNSAISFCFVSPLSLASEQSRRFIPSCSFDLTFFSGVCVCVCVCVDFLYPLTLLACGM